VSNNRLTWWNLKWCNLTLTDHQSWIGSCLCLLMTHAAAMLLRLSDLSETPSQTWKKTSCQRSFSIQKMAVLFTIKVASKTPGAQAFLPPLSTIIVHFHNPQWANWTTSSIIFPSFVWAHANNPISKWSILMFFPKVRSRKGLKRIKWILLKLWAGLMAISINKTTQSNMWLTARLNVWTKNFNAITVEDSL